MRAARFKVLCSALEVLLEISDSLVPCFFALFAAFVAMVRRASRSAASAAASAASSSASTSETGRRATVPPNFVEMLSSTSGVTSDTWARMAVVPGATRALRSPRTVSRLSAWSMSLRLPITEPAPHPRSMPSGPPSRPTIRPMRPPSCRALADRRVRSLRQVQVSVLLAFRDEC